MFLTMTQPEDIEGTIDWFWDLACRMFLQMGQFGDLTSEVISRDGRPQDYSPTRFTHKGRFETSDIARHFHGCGMTLRFANTIFRDFAKVYFQHHSPAVEPSWDAVPAPHPRVIHPTPNQLKRKKLKLNKAAKKATASSGKSLRDQIEEPSAVVGASDALTYDEAPPAGVPIDGDVEMANEAAQSEGNSVPSHQLPYLPLGPT